ncbi:hypothetical protein ACVWW4_004178 [Bradyrhizobium sp. LB7.1]
MLALGLVLNTLGIGLFCWLSFALVYALPCFVSLSMGMVACRDGASIFGALLIGIASGSLTLAAGQVAVAASWSLTLRVAIAAVFAVPAAIAGYHVVFALSQIGVPSLVWREAFACLSTVCIGGTAWTRLRVLAKTRPLESGRAVERSQPVLTATIRKGRPLRLHHRTGSRKSVR